MKEYVTKEIKPNKYEYGYKIQKMDIKMMMELGLPVPNKIKEIYKEGFLDLELKDYIYFNDPVITEFISRQYYLRDTVEFSNMNLYEIEFILNCYEKDISGIENIINKKLEKNRSLDLQIKLILLKNEMQSIMYLRDEMIENYNSKAR